MLKGFRSTTQRVDEAVADPVPARQRTTAEAPSRLRARPAAAILDADPQHGATLAGMCRASGIDAAVHEEPAAFLRGVSVRSPELAFVEVMEHGDAAIEVLYALGQGGFGGSVQLLGRDAAPVLEVVQRLGARHGLKMLPALEKPVEGPAIRNLFLREGFATSTPLGVALGAAQVEFWYQPKIHLGLRQIVGVETLARFRHPEQGTLAPATFLADACPYDLAELARAALAAALHAAAEFARLGLCLRVAVNTPVSALSELPIADMVRELGPTTPRWTGLLLDLDAADLAADFPRVEAAAEALAAANVRFAVDNFGSAELPLSDLRKLPLAELKLARAIVSGCATDSARLAACRDAVEAARKLELTAVAIGLESAAEMKALSELGCEIGQGYLFGQPMPQARLVEIVHKRAVTPPQASRPPAERPVQPVRQRGPRAVWS